MRLRATKKSKVEGRTGMISESKPSYKVSSVIAEMVKVADTPCPKGKQVGWEGNGPNSAEA